MVKRVLLAIALMGVLAFAGLQAWWASPSVSDPARAEKIYTDALGRVQARDALAHDASTNGYCDLAPFEGPGVHARDLLYWALANDFVYPLMQKNRDIMMVYGTDSSQIAGIEPAVQRFQALLPAVDRALARPNFAWASEWDQPTRAKGPGKLGGYGLALGLAGYAQYCEATGDLSQALHYNLAVLEMGAKWAHNGGARDCSLGLQQEALGLQSAFQFLGRSPALTPWDCRSAMARLDALPLSPQTLLDRLDEDYAYGLQCVDAMQRDPSRRPPASRRQRLAWMIPGAMARERRMLQNLYLLARPSYEKMHPLTEDGTDWDSLVKGSDSALARSLTSPSDELVATFRDTLAKIGGLKLGLALHVYKTERGSYPDHLEQLTPGLMDAVPRNPASPDGRYLYQRKGDDYVLSYTVTPALQRWLRTTTCHLHPPEPPK